MSRDIAENLVPIQDPEQLRAPFVDACKSKNCQRRIGTEHEKFGYDRETLEPLPYEGERGIERLLLLLCEPMILALCFSLASLRLSVGIGFRKACRYSFAMLNGNAARQRRLTVDSLASAFRFGDELATISRIRSSTSPGRSLMKQRRAAFDAPISLRAST